jgi:hypothetical protein
MRDGQPSQGAGEAARADYGDAPQGGSGGNGVHDTSPAAHEHEHQPREAPPMREPATQREYHAEPREAPPMREPAPQREYHAEQREAAPAHEPAPLAHFEPTPKPDPGKPYVVWSSAPPQKEPGGTGGPEE